MGMMQKFDGWDSDGRRFGHYLIDGEYHPDSAIVENTVAPKFSKPIRMLDSFTKNFSRMGL